MDDADYLRVFDLRWRRTKQGYVVSGRGYTKPLHRVLLAPIPEGMEVDHINGDKLDNRRSNLRVVTHRENSYNQGAYKGRRYKGVYFHAKTGKWRASLNKDRRTHYLGLFETEEDAARAYNEAAREIFGAFARLNDVREKALDRRND